MAERNKNELIKAAQALAAQFQERWNDREITPKIQELQDLEHEMQRPGFWDKPDQAREITQKKARLERQTGPWQDLRREIGDLSDLVELTFEEEPETAQAQMNDEIRRLEEGFEALLLEEALQGEDDHRNAVVTISSGAGGTESQDWVSMLLRMYLRWFERAGFRADVVDAQDGEEAGLKSASLIVRGENAFGRIKSENGVHRLVRISPFDSNKRRHTSFAAVHVAPELDDDVAVTIEKKDIREDTYRASGAGGQHVNKTDSAIRITHIPTGVVVQCQNERSQHKNRATAMKMLQARLHEIEKQRMEQDAESRSGEKKDVAWGSQIRSYVFQPYQMVKDLRTGHETGNIEAVMDGDLDPFSQAYLKSLLAFKTAPAEPAQNT